MRNTSQAVCKVIVDHTVKGLLSTVEAVVIVLKLLHDIGSVHDLGVSALVGVADFLEYLTERVEAVVAALEEYQNSHTYCNYVSALVFL